MDELRECIGCRREFSPGPNERGEICPDCELILCVSDTALPCIDPFADILASAETVIDFPVPMARPEPPPGRTVVPPPPNFASLSQPKKRDGLQDTHELTALTDTTPEFFAPVAARLPAAPQPPDTLLELAELEDAEAAERDERTRIPVLQHADVHDVPPTPWLEGRRPEWAAPSPHTAALPALERLPAPQPVESIEKDAAPLPPEDRPASGYLPSLGKIRVGWAAGLAGLRMRWSRQTATVGAACVAVMLMGYGLGRLSRSRPPAALGTVPPVGLAASVSNGTEKPPGVADSNTAPPALATSPLPDEPPAFNQGVLSRPKPREPRVEAVPAARNADLSQGDLSQGNSAPSDGQRDVRVPSHPLGDETAAKPNAPSPSELALRAGDTGPASPIPRERAKAVETPAPETAPRAVVPGSRPADSDGAPLHAAVGVVGPSPLPQPTKDGANKDDKKTSVKRFVEYERTLKQVYAKRKQLLLDRKVLLEKIIQLEKSAAEVNALLGPLHVEARQVRGAMAALDARGAMLKQQALTDLNPAGRQTAQVNYGLAADQYAAQNARLEQLAREAQPHSAKLAGLGREAQFRRQESVDLQNQADGLRVEWLKLTDPFALWDEGEVQRAVLVLSEWIVLDGEFSGAYVARSVTYYQLNQIDLAKRDAEAALRLDPQCPYALSAQGLCLTTLGEKGRAETVFLDAVRRGKDVDFVYLCRGAAAQFRRDWRKSIAQYRMAVKLSPRNPAALSRLAIVLAACPESEFRNGGESLRLATRASELLKYPCSGHLDAQAMAHAEQGEFDEAVRAAQQALELAPEFARVPLSNRLKLYQAGTPYRL